MLRNPKTEENYSKESNNVIVNRELVNTNNGTNSEDTNKENYSNNSQTPSHASYLRLFRCASTMDRIYIFFAILFSIIAGCMTPLDSFIFGILLQSIINYGKSQNTTEIDDDRLFKALIQFTLCECAIALVLFTMSYAFTVLLNTSAYNQIYRIRQEFFKAQLNQDFEYYDTHQTSDFAVKMNADIIKLEDGIGEKLGMFTYYQASFLSSVIVSLALGWKLALLCLVSLPLTIALVGAAGLISSKLSKIEAVAAGKAGAIAEEVLSAIRTVFAFCGQRKELELYTKRLNDSKNINIRRGIFNGLAMGLLYFCIFGAYALSMWFSYYLMVSEPETYDVTTVITVFLGIMMGSENFGVSSTLMEVFGMASGAGAQIFDLLDQVPKINSLFDKGLKPYGIKGNIEVKNVNFYYPSRPNIQVLNGINLSVKQGQSVALVGHSGCGKSTIIQLISRFYDVTSGRVTVDGNDVKNLSVNWLRHQIGLVGQEPVLFNTTIRENIRYGRDDASDTDVEVAAKQANAHKFILKLPNGYDTLIGERGSSLSGGQKQRIAIARALIRNPAILLLDEATSALDTSSEIKVQQALDKAKVGRTTVIVAHRLSTIRNVDVIYVLKNGIVVEQGNHYELMKKEGHYHEMIKIQSYNGSNDLELGAENTKQLLREESIASVKDEDEEIDKVCDLFEEPGDNKKISFWEVLLLNKPEWKSILVGTVCSLANGFGMPAFSVIFGNFLGILSEPDKDKVRAEVIGITIIFLIVGLISGILNFFIVYMYTRAGEYLTERLRRLLFEKFLQQEIAFFDDKDNSIGTLCAKLSSEAALVQGATGQRIGTVVGAVGTFTFSLLLSLYYEWRVGLVALVFMPALAFVVIKEERMSNDESFRTSALEKSSKIAVEALSNVRTVASLGKEEYFIKKYRNQLLPAVVEAKKRAHMRGIVYGLSQSFFNFVFAAAMYYGVTLIINERINYEGILISCQALLFGATSAAEVLAFAPNFKEGIKAAGRVISTLNKQSKITDPKEPNEEKFEGSGEASLNMVQFKYPTQPTTLILKNFSLTIEHGKTIALVGASGSGKSTVIQLLERFYDPDEGTVFLDSTPLKNLRLADARQIMGFVQQEPVLFDRSIQENIAYGDNTRVPTNEEIVEAAKQANIHNFIVSLPQGYQTNIGSKGVQLSGGQKQRIAIARALLRKPKLLLLDEATSALDTESEKVVQEALDRAKAERTCVMIAHRLSTVRDADLICVVHGGRITESGTHTHLMQLKGLYYRLTVQG